MRPRTCDRVADVVVTDSDKREILRSYLLVGTVATLLQGDLSESELCIHGAQTSMLDKAVAPSSGRCFLPCSRNLAFHRSGQQCTAPLNLVRV